MKMSRPKSNCDTPSKVVILSSRCDFFFLYVNVPSSTGFLSSNQAKVGCFIVNSTIVTQFVYGALEGVAAHSSLAARVVSASIHVARMPQMLKLSFLIFFYRLCSIAFQKVRLSSRS